MVGANVRASQDGRSAGSSHRSAGFEDVVLHRQQPRGNSEPSATEIAEDQVTQNEIGVCWRCSEGRTRQQDEAARIAI